MAPISSTTVGRARFIKIAAIDSAFVPDISKGNLSKLVYLRAVRKIVTDARTAT
jgi:hypothetical protein